MLAKIQNIYTKKYCFKQKNRRVVLLYRLFTHKNTGKTLILARLFCTFAFKITKDISKNYR